MANKYGQNGRFWVRAERANHHKIDGQSQLVRSFILSPGPTNKTVNSPDIFVGKQEKFAPRKEKSGLSYM